MTMLTKQGRLKRRHNRVRAKVMGTGERPRLSMYKSNTRVIAQIIDDERGVTLAAVSSSSEKGKTPKERAEKAAVTLAKQAGDMKVTKIVFDRGGFKYAGTIKAFADAARAAGLTF